MTTRQPEALRLAEILEGGYSLAWLYERGGYEVSAELRRQHARITELESQLAQRFGAADMATAAADGFRSAAAAMVAKLKGERKVLWNLLGECLPVIDALMQIPGDDDSDAHLNGLAGRINDARTAVQAEELPASEGGN